MNKVLAIEKNLNKWFVENDFKGHDPYQLDEKASGLINKMPFLKYVRKILKPFHSFIPSAAFSGLPKIYHPKALGLIIGGNAFLYSVTGENELLKQNTELIKLLKLLRNKNYKHFAWGSPFEWGSNPRYPANTPAVCLIVPIANALLDYYKISNDKEALEISADIALHIIEENGFTEINEDSICLYYSPVDKNEVYNSNALAAHFLFRLNSYVENNYQIELAKRICQFVIDAQSADGSWVYSKTSDIIDNRHTGFIIESLAGIRKYWKNESLDKAYFKGLEFYKTRLMNNELPRWSISQTYPIDIHDVAQSIITFAEVGDLIKARKIADFAINKISNQKDEFFFKYFKNGRVNKSVFIRWGQAWMYYALGKLIDNGKMESYV